MAVLQVIGEFTGNVKTDIEGLVTYQHTFFKRLPRQHLRRTMAAQSQEMPIGIGDRRIAIDDGREF